MVVEPAQWTLLPHCTAYFTMVHWIFRHWLEVCETSPCNMLHHSATGTCPCCRLHIKGQVPSQWSNACYASWAWDQVKEQQSQLGKSLLCTVCVCVCKTKAFKWERGNNSLSHKKCVVLLFSWAWGACSKHSLLPMTSFLCYSHTLLSRCAALCHF